MRIVCISDTHTLHNRLYNIPKGDVIVHSGDFTSNGRFLEMEDFIEWFSSLGFEQLILIAGNLDEFFQRVIRMHWLEVLKKKNIHYLEDSHVTIDNVKFYGTPWQPEFCNWAFNLPRGKLLLEKWKMIPNDTDVLVTHTPPYGVLDTIIPNSELGDGNLGCFDLYSEVMNRINPRLHIFGHIHGSYGIETVGSTTFVNASLLNEDYELVNLPVVIDIPNHR